MLSAVSGQPSAGHAWYRWPWKTAQLVAGLVLLAGCSRGGSVQVAVGVDPSLARPLLNEFAELEKATLDQTRAEGAEVIWDRDPERVLRDAAAGSLAPLPEGVTGRPPPLMDAQRRWAAIAALGRVIVYDPQRLADDAAPTRVLDLARPEYAHQLVLADPTGGGVGLWHAAALCARLGDEEGLAFFRALRHGGARVVADEDAVLSALTTGQQPLALLDSDRAYLAQTALPRLVITIPDQGDAYSGVFVLPSVVAVTTRGVANERALALADFLLAAPQAFRVALTSNAFVVAADGKAPPGLLNVAQMKLMPVVYGELLERLPAIRTGLAAAVSGQLEGRAPARPHAMVTTPYAPG